MNHNIHDDTAVNTYTFKNFIPLIVIASCIVSFTLIKQLLHRPNLQQAMYDFMGSFFIIFGAFKIINLRGFVEAYSLYDIIAQQSILYAYLYPFIELALGIMYLTRYETTLANWITVIIMIISSISVARELRRKRPIACACLGAVFTVPMTYVTLIEDLLMGLMAAIMILGGY